MHVDMKNRLPCTGSIVEHHPEIVADTMLCCQLCTEAHYFADQLFIRFRYI